METVLNARYTKQGDECNVHPCAVEICEISKKDKTKTLSSNMFTGACKSAGSPVSTKIENVFQKWMWNIEK